MYSEMLNTDKFWWTINFKYIINKIAHMHTFHWKNGTIPNKSKVNVNVVWKLTILISS